ncbi:MAG: AMP-binding protein [Pigmentiphaga sp.]|uniref:class I adenylate-forming enzyme family protein n=1 Tax=Pigmentiphaga sp. TaxID=1977564 RepID=UPI0029BAB043|nr:AMP-binding protein [Pigmentiphaga sp.]MDX3905831.1 AMP-binding protein [Pigmentiphaga sp.]
MAVGRILEHHAGLNPDSEALVFGARRLTWRELDTGANRVGHLLQSLGAEHGDRVVLLLNNSVEFVESYFGIAKIGCISAPVMPTLVGSEIAFIANKLRARFMIVEASAAGMYRSIADELASVEKVIGVGPDHGLPIDYASATALCPSCVPDTEVEPTDDLTIKFTSGTTGRPKGCVRTHQAFIMGLLSALTEHPLRQDDVGLVAQPLAAGMAVYYLLLYLYQGMRVVMLPKFDADLYLDAVEREGITHATAMDWMARRLSAHPGFMGRDLGSLRILHGINQIRSLDSWRAQPTFRADITAGYASSEAGGLVTFKTPMDFRQAFADPAFPGTHSCGRPGRLCQVECVDEQLEPVAVGEVGEIAISGPAMFRGYWELPEDTAKAIRNGWLLTGDLAYRDERGYLFLCGRKRDMIRSGGINVYPAEIEPVLLAHHAVREAAVVGVPDSHWGERVVACIVPQSSCTEEEILAYCRERLGAPKRPKSVRFFESLPTNATGKIIKKDLVLILQGQETGPRAENL